MGPCVSMDAHLGVAHAPLGVILFRSLVVRSYAAHFLESFFSDSSFSAACQAPFILLQDQWDRYHFEHPVRSVAQLICVVCAVWVLIVQALWTKASCMYVPYMRTWPCP